MSTKSGEFQCVSYGATNFDGQKLKALWKIYISDPSVKNIEKGFEELPKDTHIHFVGEKDELEAISFIYENLDILKGQVYSQNRNALKLGIRLMLISDAAFSEYLDDIVGKMITINPVLFLEEIAAQRNSVSLYHVTGYSGSEYVDNFKAQVEELKKRENALLTVNNKRLVPLRDECVKLIEEDIKFINEIPEGQNE